MQTFLSKCISGNFSVPEDQQFEFKTTVHDAVAKILGKDIAKFKRLSIDRDGKVTLLTGRTKSDEGYSEFHFGAGESSIIRMVASIEQAEENSIVLIEEIENGLHPVATVRMVEYLIEVAERKRVQAIFTTHSNDALKPLPNKAIWVAMQNRVFQGKLDVHSLRAITGQVEAALVVFVEDQFAAEWLRAIIRSSNGMLMDQIEVHAMEGDGTAVAMNKYHNDDPSILKPSICYIDGDSSQMDSVAHKVYRLPGAMPESYIFDSVMGAWDRFGGKLAVACLQKFEDANHVKDICESIKRTNRDPHVLFAQVGERLGLIPASTIAQAFVTIWAQANPESVESILDTVKAAVPAV